MKKQLLLTLVLAFFAMFQGNSQSIYESFEGTFPPEDWTITGSWTQSTSRAYDGDKCAFLSWEGTNGRMIMPAYTAEATTTLTFYMGADYPTYAHLNVFTIEVATSLEEPVWQEVYAVAYPGSSSGFFLKEVNLGSFAGQEIYVSFNVTPNSGSGTFIDAVALGEVTCPKPTGLAAVTSSTTVDFTWAQDETSLAYNIEVVPTNQDWANAEVAQVDDTIFTLTDLMPATMYKARLQSVCEDDELSQYSDIVTFTTGCAPIEDIIWFEDFESVYGNQDAANLLFSCWSVLQSTGGAYNGTFPRIYHEGYAGSAHSGVVTLEFKGDGFLLLPEFVQDITTQQLSFYANTTSSTVEGAGTFQVGYVTDPTDTATFVPLETVVLPQAGLGRASSVMVGPYSYADVDAESPRMALKYVAANAGESWNLDDFTVEPIPLCPAPQSSSITVTGITDSEATITWVDEDESHNAWLFYYKSETEEEYNEISTTEQSITLTDLNQATSYSFYIQTDCGISENYSQTSIITFRTTAVPVAEFPYYQDFQDLESNPFAAEFYGSGTNQWMVGSGTGVVNSENEDEEQTSLYISNNNSTYAYTTEQNLSRSWVVIPIVFGDAPEYSISFQYKSGGEQSWNSIYDFLSVVLCDASADLTNLNGVPSGTVILDRAVNVTEWETANYASAELANTTKQLVFYWYNDGTSGTGVPGAIDNISIVENTCPSPTNVTCSGALAEEAVFNWNTENASSWLLYYKSASETEYTEVEVTEVPFTLTELTPMTQYSAYVVTNCDGELSAASTTISFRTACSTIETFPYFEGFNTANNFQDVCWSAQQISGSYNWGVNVSGSNNIGVYEGQYCARITYFTGQARLTSPIFNLSEMTNPYLKYAVVNPDYNGAAEQVIVEYKATPESDWVTLRSYTTANETWLLDSVALPLASETYQISFRAIGAEAWGASVDAIQIYDLDAEPGETDPENPCAAPTDLTVSNITENSADVSWNATADAYEIRLNAGAIETVTTTSQQLIGLPDNFTITVEVRAICGEQISEWVSTTFTTLAVTDPDPEPEPCSPITEYPFFESFETTYDCWTITTLAGSGNWLQEDWLISYSGTDPVMLPAVDGAKMMKHSAISGYSARLESPVLDLTSLETPYVKFNFGLTDMFGISQDNLVVKYRTSQTEEWTTLATYTTPVSQWVLDSIALPNPTATYQVGFESMGVGAWGVVVDAITVYDPNAGEGGTDPDPEPQPCDAPTALTASNITETTAEITWNGTAEAYEFKLNGGEAETLTTTTKSLTDLTPNTTYTVEVRAVCGEQTSDWVSTTFTTIEQIVIVLAEVTTSPATEVGNTSATLNGALVNAGNSENIAVGFALATVADFTLETADVQNITATLTDATFSQVVTDLAQGQTYFYRAYATNEAGTAYGAVETFTLSGLTDALANAINAVVYPNPATSQATLEINGLNQDAKIVISDLQGRILSQDQISAGKTRYTINVSEMASGVYYIRIVTDSVVSTQKLIVE
jgi:hypothetical protein